MFRCQEGREAVLEISLRAPVAGCPLILSLKNMFDFIFLPGSAGGDFS
jgi:hypothetical protein